MHIKDIGFTDTPAWEITKGETTFVFYPNMRYVWILVPGSADTHSGFPVKSYEDLQKSGKFTDAEITLLRLQMGPIHRLEAQKVHFNYW